MTNNEPVSVQRGTGSIGRRLASYRKVLGFNSAQELADAIPNEKLTASVIQNIESGRKADLTVSQLLDISMALGISPIYLLSPIGRPEEKVDLAGVGEAVANLTNHEFDRWISVLDAEVKTEKDVRANLRYILRSIRSIYEDLEEREAVLNHSHLNADPEDYIEVDDEGNKRTLTYDPAPLLQGRLYHLDEMITTRISSLERISSTVDLSAAREALKRRPIDG